MNLAESRHGGDIFGFDDEEQENVLDFSININPVGLSPLGKKKLLKYLETDILRYPDIKCRSLIKALSLRYNMDESFISVGNGATELMYTILRVLTPDKVYIPAPGFSEYKLSAKSVGIEAVEFPLKKSSGFSVPVSMIISRMKSHSAIYLGNPNNPDGQCLSEKSFYEIINAAQRNDSIVILDESFIDFLGDEWSYRQKCKEYKNLIIITSLTKFYAVPGLRIGCSFSYPEIACKIKDALIPWNVNGLAQRYMTYALEDKSYHEETVRYCSEERIKMLNGLSLIKEIKVCDGTVNFILCRLNGRFSNAQELQEALLPFHILIRQCGNYTGLDKSYFRLAIRTDTENQKLLEALRKVFHP